jgi:hypothetical protein
MKRNPVVPGQQTLKDARWHAVARRAQSYNKRILSRHYNQQTFKKSRLCNRCELPTVTAKMTADAVTKEGFSTFASLFKPHTSRGSELRGASSFATLFYCKSLDYLEKSQRFIVEVMRDIFGPNVCAIQITHRRWENIPILDFYWQADALPCPRMAISRVGNACSRPLWQRVQQSIWRSS